MESDQYHQSNACSLIKKARQQDKVIQVNFYFLSVPVSFLMLRGGKEKTKQKKTSGELRRFVVCVKDEEFQMVLRSSSVLSVFLLFGLKKKKKKKKNKKRRLSCNQVK